MRPTTPGSAALIPLLVASTLSAQVPEVGPEGDPSVQDDTIYALAVDPADHPEEDVVVLLDDGIVVQEHDGTGRRTYRTVAQVLAREAVEGWAEHTWGFDGDREEFTLNWVRVVGADGEVVSDEPIHHQVMDLPVPEQSPIYTNWKRVRVSLAGVEPGSIVDYSYTIRTVDPIMPGEFLSNWTITTGGTIKRSRLILDVPADYGLRMVERNVSRPARVSEVEGRRIMEWTAADLPWIEPELFPAVGEADFLEGLTVGGPGRWEDVGAWYAGLARGRYEVDDEVLAAAEEAMAGASTDEDRLAALYRWVAQDFRYVSISLGQGGYQPRIPAEVFATRSGDCKDKATLFIGLARALGFEAYPVLLDSNGGVEEELPSIKQFDHVIAAVRRGEEWLFLDLTAQIVPFGEIPPGYQGEFGLVVFDDGASEAVTFPEPGPERNRTETLLEGTLSPAGAFSGWYSERSSGILQYELRSGLAQSFTERELTLLADALAGGIMAGATGDSLQVFDGRDLQAEPLVRLKVDATRAARAQGSSGWVFTLPLVRFVDASTVARLEEELERRRYPIDVRQVVGPLSRRVELRLTLPEGWTADLPESVDARSTFGRYRGEYRQEGGVVTVVREVTGREGTEPPEALPELIDWLRQVESDDASFLLLHPPAAGR